ncbi:MAG: hypothetical protein ABL982_25440, partial [Vicinamibacterales bacterium]
DYAEIESLRRLLAAPFDEQPGNEHYAALPPDWVAHPEAALDRAREVLDRLRALTGGAQALAQVQRRLHHHDIAALAAQPLTRGQRRAVRSVIR